VVPKEESKKVEAPLAAAPKPEPQPIAKEEPTLAE
jgi:hypothetical protein